MSTLSVPRPTYHHGNLREELIDVAVRRARADGPSALALRELAREVGVTSAAVYRHFPDLDHLRAVVAQRAREELAQSMLDASDAVPAMRSRANRAVACFTAIGSAYVQFAADEPGLFHTAFIACSSAPERPDDPSAWQILNDALDDLVAVGRLDRARLADAPLIAWTSVHGLATLIVTGDGLPPGTTVQHATTAIIRGIHRSLGISPLQSTKGRTA